MALLLPLQFHYLQSSWNRRITHPKTTDGLERVNCTWKVVAVIMIVRIAFFLVDITLLLSYVAHRLIHGRDMPS
jgi:hypothetical protein